MQTITQLTWRAPLTKFKRGYETSPVQVDWQFHSGKHLRCAVLSSRPTSQSLSQSSSSQRELRIVIECGLFEADTARPSSSQTNTALVLVRSYSPRTRSWVEIY